VTGLGPSDCAIRHPTGAAEVVYRPGFVAAAEADRLLAGLIALPDWRQERLRMFGREVDAPRLTAWYGDPGCRYAYSGVVHDPRPWPPEIADLRDRLCHALEVPFDGVLANRYRDGRDSMGWHSDDERELGPRPVIASLSFGEERRFLLRERGVASGREAATHEIVLGHGSLLVMRGDSQRRYRHSLPKSARCRGERVNLTFRVVRGPLRGCDGRSPRPEERTSPAR